MAQAPRLARKRTPAATQQKVNILNSEHPDYEAQADDWEQMEDLYMGSKRVKAKGTKYLPSSSVEEEELRTNRGGSVRTAYDRRKERAVFFNGVARLARYAMGHIYRVDPVPQGTLPKSFEAIRKDCDLLGTPLFTFMKQVNTLTYVMGMHLVMVDFPQMSGVDSRSVEKMINPRPYLIPVAASEIINWSIRRSLDGTLEFDWLVHRYAFYESPDPHTGHRLTVYYKIWYKTKWELWKVELTDSTGDGGFNSPAIEAAQPTLETRGANPLGMVPYVPFYAEYLRPMVGKSPLEEAASLNIDHYRAFSDFTHGLRYHLNPILVTIGTVEDTVKRDATSGLNLPRNGDAKYVETSGNSLKIALETADRIAAEMWEAGMRSSAAVGANTSAEARKIARGDFFSFLTGVVSSWESSWARVMHLVALWDKETGYSNEKPLKLNEDFDLAQLEANAAEFLLNARKAGEISKNLFITELVRGGILKGDLNVPEEIKAAERDLKADLAALVEAERASSPDNGTPADPEGTDGPKPPEEVEP